MTSATSQQSCRYCDNDKFLIIAKYDKMKAIKLECINCKFTFTAWIRGN